MLDDILKDLGIEEDDINCAAAIFDVASKLKKKDPRALDGSIVEYYLVENHGEQAYFAARKIYLGLIGAPLENSQENFSRKKPGDAPRVIYLNERTESSKNIGDKNGY